MLILNNINALQGGELRSMVTGGAGKVPLYPVVVGNDDINKVGGGSPRGDPCAESEGI